MAAIDICLCRSKLRELALRMTANPQSPFGMPGVGLFACDMNGTILREFVGTDAWLTPLESSSTVCLASLGKLAIALIVLDLVSRGQVDLRDTLSNTIGRRYGTVGDSTIAELLSHRSGAPACLSEQDLPYAPELTKDRVRASCRSQNRSTSYSLRVRYSDVAYALLADIVELKHKKSLGACLSILNGTIGTRLSLGEPPDSSYIRLIGIPSPYVDTPLEPLNSPFWHSLALPWAGICGAPDDGLRLVREFSQAGILLDANIRGLAVALPESSEIPPGGITATGPQMGFGPTQAIEWESCCWGLGVEIRGDKTPHWTPSESHKTSFGHVGISGTLAWCDPTVGICWGMTGTRSSHSGWLLRYGPLLGKAVMSSVIRQ